MIHTVGNKTVIFFKHPPPPIAALALEVSNSHVRITCLALARVHIVRESVQHCITLSKDTALKVMQYPARYKGLLIGVEWRWHIKRQVSAYHRANYYTLHLHKH